jgi:pilus assembly protein TadC
MKETIMADRVNGFLGDTPLRIFIKLAIISLIVGVVMRSLGWMPLDIVRMVRTLFERIWNMGFAAFADVADYLVLGAAIVIPAFILLRLFAMRRG